MNELEFLDDRLCVTSAHSHDGVRHCAARLVSSGACCPDCGRFCHRRHSFTTRRLKDFSGIHQVFRLNIQVPKWFCDNSICQRSIFTERLPWAISHSRRTLRTERVLSTLMLAMSAKEAERVTTVLGFRISHDTLLRVLRRVPVPSPCAEVIGIDDFAFKKGHRYGTIICDATTHRPIDLLRTREADMLKDWLVNLEKRPIRASVDRFPAYQEALLDQDIVVVSDRFHLVDNLWRCLNSICQRVLPSRIPVNPKGAVSYGLKPQHPTGSENETKRPLVERVQSMHRQGMSLNAIAQMLSLNWRTVKKYSDPAYEPSPPKRQRPHLIDRFMPQLRECVRNRYTLQETDAHLRQLGYRGSFGAVRHRSRDARREGLPEPQVFVSRKDACRLLWQWPVTRPDDTIDVSYLLVRYEDLAIPFCFIQGFREAIRERDAGHLLSLITNPQVTSHPGLKRFVGRLKQNVEVILAACQFEESNGYVEGNVNRLKMMKRLMYGRGNFDLLRIRVLCRNPDPSCAH